MQRRSIRLGLTIILLPIAAMALFAQGQGQGRGRGPQAPARPTPRMANGRVNLGPPPGELGLWLPADARLSVPDVGVGRGPGGAGPKYPNLKYSQVPFQPWARALLDYRLEYAFEPHTRCKRPAARDSR